VGAASNDFFGAGSVITGSIVSFTELLATLLVETLEFGTGVEGDWIAVDDDACFDRIKADEQLCGRWERFFLRGAGIFFTEDEARPELTERQRTAKGQLTSAMEVFAFGHEYGYHIAQQSPATGAEKAFHCEFAADEIAWSVAKFLGARAFAGDVGKVRNTWLESNAGAVALLRGAQIVRCVRQVLETGAHQEEPLHPSYVKRLAALEKMERSSQEPLREQFVCQRRLFGRLLPRIFDELAIRFCAAHQAGLRPLRAATVRDRVVAETNASNPDLVDPGLVDILVSEVVNKSDIDVQATGHAFDASTSAPQIAATDGLAIAREYLRHYQEKSVRQLAESTIASRLGIIDPSLSKTVTDRLRMGRTAGAPHGFQKLLEDYCDLIKQACTKLELPVRGGVAPGVVWHPGLVPAQQEFSDTGTSLIVIPESTLMLCYFISKLLVKAFSIRAEGDRLAVSFNAKKIVARLRSRAKLRNFAAGFFAYSATGNRRCLRPLSNAAGDQRPVGFQLLTAMELFVVAHEYSHHILEHGLQGCVSVDGPASELLKAQELQADWHAALITANIGAESRLSFAYDCTGAVAALVGTDLLRRARAVLATGREQPFTSDSHPPLEHRLLILEMLRYDPRVADAVRSSQRNFHEIMESIWDLILPNIRDFHARGFRPISLAHGGPSWLPFSANRSKIAGNEYQLVT
jgi:hypothetical protein